METCLFTCTVAGQKYHTGTEQHNARNIFWKREPNGSDIAHPDILTWHIKFFSYPHEKLLQSFLHISTCKPLWYYTGLSLTWNLYIWENCLKECINCNLYSNCLSGRAVSPIHKFDLVIGLSDSTCMQASLSLCKTHYAYGTLGTVRLGFTQAPAIHMSQMLI